MFLAADSEMTICLQERFLKFYEKATLGMTALRHWIRWIQEVEAGGAALHQKDPVISPARPDIHQGDMQRPWRKHK